jgi:hypothetical protein
VDFLLFGLKLESYNVLDLWDNNVNNNGVQFELSLDHGKGFEMYILKIISRFVKKYEAQVMTKIMI